MYLFLYIKTSVTFKVLSIWCNAPIGTFFHCSKQFRTSRFSCLLVVFCFTSSTSQQNISLGGLFSWGNKKTSLGARWGEIGRRVGHGGHAVFGENLLNTQHSVGRCVRKSPTMKWANALKESSKKFTEAECSLSHWYRWFLEHLPSRGNLHNKGSALQKAIPFYFFFVTLDDIG